MAPGYDIAGEIVEALVACAKAAVDESTAASYRRQAAALPSQFGYLAETVIAHWRRRGDAEPTKKSFRDVLNEKGIQRPARPEPGSMPFKSIDGTELNDLLADIDGGERERARSRAAKLGLQFVDLTRIPIEPGAVALVPAPICRAHTIIPVRLDNTSIPHKLIIVLCDINTSLAAIDDIRLASRCQITPVLATRQDILDAIDRVYGKPPQE